MNILGRVLEAMLDAGIAKDSAKEQQVRDRVEQWWELQPAVRKLFEVDYFFVDTHRKKMVIDTWGTVRLDMLQELSRLTGSSDIEIIATDREDARAAAWKAVRARAKADVEDEPMEPHGDSFTEGLLIQVFADRGK